ncbi:hypothetical protein K353_06120 [Kitasatospora sp. SolWspMP-SS2h]|uniref:hypothetical protein n=1 Tax=Kitasatospora sp. SolWspMP-SS2h TaxID=1305729 RepID=UPI000DC0292E|nr:hypothetical protein [Kitasatospora sp. SolWspMP-SS2h]RAJ31769.1 hypothetical protein K353_06120 [Kitasatospora sp. SolWspMP-SS2h]
MTFENQGSDAVRARDIHLNLSSDRLGALVRAEDESEVREVIRPALAEHFNQGTYGTIRPEDFTFATSPAVCLSPWLVGAGCVRMRCGRLRRSGCRC